MKTLKSTEPFVNPDNPFEDCKLDREKYADNLTRIIENYPSGFVMALNNRWGDGKTFFVNRWIAKLKEKERFQVVYYNAWEDDYSENALVSILSEIKDDIVPKSDAQFNKLLKSSTNFIAKAVPIVIKSGVKLVSGILGTDEIFEIIGSNYGKKMTDLVDQHIKQKESVKGFKKSLTNFANKKGKGKPIVFFIDELDRCKPSYAVEVLEIIKHLFSVENIVFVLSVDKGQLANSICGYYGSDNIDGNEYLRRFIDLEFSLPKPELKSLINSSFNELKFDEFYKPFRNRYDQIINEKDQFISFCISFFENKDLKIREIKKLLIKTRTVLYTFEASSYSIPSVLLVLIYLHSEMNESFQKIKLKRIDIKELLETNKSLLLLDTNSPIPDGFRKQEFLVYSLYKNYILNNVHQDKLMESTKEGFQANFENVSIDWQSLYLFLKSENSPNVEADFSLDFLINKIELSENLKFNN